MRNHIGVVIACLGLFIITAAPARAHHSFAVEFDSNKPLTLKGTLVEWEMINPHSWFHIDVKGDDGEVVRWMIEGGSPNQLIRMGVTKKSVSVGAELIIEGYQARDGTNKAVGRNIVLPDGSRLFVGGSASKIKQEE